MGQSLTKDRKNKEGKIGRFPSLFLRQNKDKSVVEEKQKIKKTFLSRIGNGISKALHRNNVAVIPHSEKALLFTEDGTAKFGLLWKDNYGEQIYLSDEVLHNNLVDISAKNSNKDSHTQLKTRKKLWKSFKVVKKSRVDRGEWVEKVTKEEGKKAKHNINVIPIDVGDEMSKEQKVFHTEETVYEENACPLNPCQKEYFGDASESQQHLESDGNESAYEMARENPQSDVEGEEQHLNNTDSEEEDEVENEEDPFTGSIKHQCTITDNAFINSFVSVYQGDVHHDTVSYYYCNPTTDDQSSSTTESVAASYPNTMQGNEQDTSFECNNSESQSPSVMLPFAQPHNLFHIVRQLLCSSTDDDTRPVIHV